MTDFLSIRKATGDMAPSITSRGSFVRPGTSDRNGRPLTREAGENAIVIPSRTSSLHSRITQPIPSTLNLKPNQRTPKTLTHAYMVCGVGREPSQWVKAPPPPQGKIQHMKGAVGQFWLPEILGSSPRLEQDNEIARSLHAAMRACFPHDVEVCSGRSQPHCVHHSFVLQQDSSHTLYGIALRVWSRADEKRAETIRELRRRSESDYLESTDETYWIPYCLSFLSRYPIYNLLGDYLRGMWIHWNKATNLFHAEEVSRILSFPAPRLNDLVRIDMKDYALCYQFPSSPTGFQNFSMWPLFTCLSVPNIVGVIEAALSPTRRIIFSSHYPAMLTIAAETVRYLVRVYEWSGLYVPVVHARHVRDMVQEPGPYILGVTAECRNLFTAPPDALVVDLDRNFVLTSSPPTALTPGQRNKMITRLTNAMNGDIIPSGVPNHLRSAYGGGKLIPAGQIIVISGEVESIQDPAWWNGDNVMMILDHVCDKMGRNTGMKALFGGSVKKPLVTKVSTRHFNEIVRERNQYSRDAMEAWQDFINLKYRMDAELTKATKRNSFLSEEIESWKAQFEKFQAFAAQLTKEATDLKNKIETHKRENRRLTSVLEQTKDDEARIRTRLAGTEKQRDDALEALVLQQEIAEELEHERQKNKKELSAMSHTGKAILRQRDEAQRVVVHLRALIDGQSQHMEHIVSSLHTAPELSEYLDEGFDDFSEEGSDKTPGEPTSSKRQSMLKKLRRTSSRIPSRASSSSASGQDAEDINSDMESRLVRSSAASKKRMSNMSVTDTADRHLRDQTDAIADIIRSISAQCAAAVEGLQMANDANDADSEGDHSRHDSVMNDSDIGDEESTELGSHGQIPITPPKDIPAPLDLSAATSASLRDSQSSLPPTPDLQRSSTSLSMVSTSLITDPTRHSTMTEREASALKIMGEGPESSEHGGSHSGDLGQPGVEETFGPSSSGAGAHMLTKKASDLARNQGGISERKEGAVRRLDGTRLALFKA